MELIKQGAEARLYLSEYNGNECIVKERFVKKYRHPELDKQITKERMKAESKAIERCTKIGVLTPKLLHMNLNEHKLYIEFIKNNQTVKDYIKNLNSNINDNVKNIKLKNLCKNIGQTIGKMHSNHIIHGDLTTSNMLIRIKTQQQHSLEEDDKKNELNDDDYDFIMIDFGLSHYSQSNEDKAVDIYVLERALLSTHSDIPELFGQILESYKENYEKHVDVIGKFEEVRARGRKRTMVG